MRLLVLGGTRFVGRAVVDQAVGRGLAVTVFNRGVSGVPPADVEVLRGDRIAPGGLAALAGRSWDAVIDTWDGAPRAVFNSASVLADAVEHYVYVSSRSVYRPPLVAGMTEDAPVESADADAVDGPYGVLKVGGEIAARAVFGDRVLLARAGLILGPHEDVGRLPWWLARLARGGNVLAPGPQDLGVQYVDVRDLAKWLLDAAEARRSGAFNVVSEAGHATMSGLLEACRQVTGCSAMLCWVDPERVLAAGVKPWTDLPIWVPPGHPFRALHQTDSGRALAAGLRCRPVEQTVAGTWEWMCSSHQADGCWSEFGLDPEAEKAILRQAGSV